MKILKNKRIITALSGLIIGTVNGFMGAGGGMIAVPLLKKCGMEQKQAHTNAVAVILPICLISAGLYLWRGQVSFNDALPFVPSGIIGSLLGTWIIRKISPFWLKKLFGCFVIYAGVRLLLK